MDVPVSEVLAEVEQMRIIVCVRDRHERDFLAIRIREVWPDAGIVTAESGQEAIRKIQTGQACDLIFLNIGAEEGISDLDVGKWIYRNFPELKMVFVSNSREFGPELFEINALHYLVKPYGRKELEEVRRRYEERVKKEAVISIHAKDHQENLPFQRIAYIESEHNNLRIHLISGTALTVRDSIQNMLKKLDDRFLRINRGVVVNMEAVEQMKADSCEIAGKTFMLSRRNRSELRRKYQDFLLDSAIRMR